MTITGRTTLVGIIGDPVRHSRSPEMHNAAFDAVGLDWRYLPFHVRASDLPDAVRGLRALGVRGFNVTIPHKESIIPLLDDLDPDTARLGAVNTVVVREGRLTGYNTDMDGFVRSLRDDARFDPSGKRALVIGAGGAARAALFGLAREGASLIVVANRTPSRADNLVKNVKDRFMGVDIRKESLAILGDAKELARFDLVVNASSVGLGGERFPGFAPSAPLVGYDMVYADHPTPFVQTIRSVSGGRAVMGHGMLAAQGEEAFRLWTGIAPPPGLMKRILESHHTDRTLSP